MVNPIDKFFHKVNKKEKLILQSLVEKILSGDVSDIDVKKLVGSSNVFRAKKGGIRIIFSKESSGEVNIISVGRRSEKTYKKF